MVPRKNTKNKTGLKLKAVHKDSKKGNIGFQTFFKKEKMKKGRWEKLQEEFNTNQTKN